MNYSEFFMEIKKLDGISAVCLKILEMLKTLQNDISDDALKIFCIYFSLLEDGNTCIVLESGTLLKKWTKKWEGLVLSHAENLMKSQTEADNQKKLEFSDFEKIINSGLSEFENQKLDSLIFDADKSENFDETNIDKFFVAKTLSGKKWLFATKYFYSKLEIEKNVKKLFNADKKEDDEKIKSLEKQIFEYFRKHARNDRNEPMQLNEKQLLAISRGQNENLIITGGPGTGKTTVVCYLLFVLLKNQKYSDYKIYLAAPSGKAAERLSESIRKSLEGIDEEEKKINQQIFENLASLDSYTIHRLLNCNPRNGEFNFNNENQFDEKSIFVIDEASMIDITLFKQLLEAIPENARIFILGDKNQLPSVNAGAVLGDLLSKKTENVVALEESNRFDSNSSVGKLAENLQNENEPLENLVEFKSFSEWKKEEDSAQISTGKSDKNPVFYIQLDKEKKQKAKNIEEIADFWTKKFYLEVAKKAEKISGTKKSDINLSQLDEIWNLSQNAKILCAERQGTRGVENLNFLVQKKLKKSMNFRLFYGEKYFPGIFLMVSKNQSLFNLSNGDQGIAVKFSDDEIFYFMTKKSAESKNENQNEKNGIFTIGSYIFYPLDFIPSDSLEVSFAITIHKSQGSGYNHILIFFPETAGHPLLNRQILYTAITRTKGEAYVVATLDGLKAAKETKIERDTKIFDED